MRRSKWKKEGFRVSEAINKGVSQEVNPEITDHRFNERL